MKQSAVEWYGLQIGILISKFFNNEISKSEVHFKRIEIEEQAKEMEKQQIIQSNRDGVDMIINEKHFITGEKYYNETFKNK